MRAFLYTWNPSLWNWVDFADAIYRLNNGQSYDAVWSTGNTKKIDIGDVFFLMRLGKRTSSKGIIGWGYIASTPEQYPHWDDEKRKNNQTTLKSEVIFKDLDDEPLITLDELQTKYPNYEWTPRSGGQFIPENIKFELLLELQQLLNITIESEDIANEVILYNEGKSKQITVNTYDRSTKARQDCILKHGYICAVCNFDFKKIYGDLGASYIEVHHLIPLAERGMEYVINPVEDLRPVCANCHRMLHRKKQVLSIDELKKIFDIQSKVSLK